MNTKNRRTPSKKIRALLAKAGLDGHDRGVKVIAQALRDAGIEVIYTGLRQSPEAIVKSAVEEDVDFVALSILSGAHRSVVPKIRRGLLRYGRGNVQMMVGGIIPQEDQKALKKFAVKHFFGPGDSLPKIIRSFLEAK